MKKILRLPAGLTALDLLGHSFQRLQRQNAL
jgi:hypothetical protein